MVRTKIRPMKSARKELAKVARKQIERKTTRKQLIRNIAKKQTARKTGGKARKTGGIARKTPGKSSPTSNALRIPTMVSLKEFAPLSIEKRGPFGPVDSIAYELAVSPEVFNPYYLNSRQHVWTDHVVVRNNIRIVNDLVQIQRDCTDLAAVRRYNQDCLDDPEKHFYMNKVGERMGHGLFAKHQIPSGSIIGEYSGELIPMAEYRVRLDHYKRSGLGNYFFETCNDMVIDAGPMGNHTRFINHTCWIKKLNCLVVQTIVGVVPKIFFISNRRIKAHEEILIYYGEDYFEELECLCGGPNCLERPKRWNRRNNQ